MVTASSSPPKVLENSTFTHMALPTSQATWVSQRPPAIVLETCHLTQLSLHEVRLYWEGKGKAEFRIGDQPERKPIRRNWNEASWVKFPGGHEYESWDHLLLVAWAFSYVI